MTDVTVEQQTVTRKRDRRISGGISTNPLLGAFRLTAKGDAGWGSVIQEEGKRSVVHRLGDVLAYIDDNESVLDLGPLIDRQAGVKLDAFCYFYSGPFRVLGRFGPRGRYSSGITINDAALSQAAGDIVISREALIEPARRENESAELDQYKRKIASNMCIIRSERGNYALQLACSLKYFSDMGGSWSDYSQEWDVVPHSGNHHFFEGGEEQWFDALFFVNGIRDYTIMGSPLVLAYAGDPTLSI